MENTRKRNPSIKNAAKSVEISSELEFGTNTSKNLSFDSDFEPGYWRSIESSILIKAEIQKDIISGNVTLIATITDISPNVLTKVTAAMLDSSGVDLTNVNCSRSTASRKMKQTAHEMAVIAKDDVELSI